MISSSSLGAQLCKCFSQTPGGAPALSLSLLHPVLGANERLKLNLALGARRARPAVAGRPQQSEILRVN